MPDERPERPEQPELPEHPNDPLELDDSLDEGVPGPYHYHPDVIAAPDASEAGLDTFRDTVDNPAISPADEAWIKQGDLVHYPGRDEWRNATADGGSESPDRVWVGVALDERGQPDLRSVSGFGVREGGLYNPRLVGDGSDPEGAQVGYDARTYYEGVQVQPRDGSYRTHLACYEFRADTEIATSTADLNTQYGRGGIEQVYVPGMADRIQDGRMVLVGLHEMQNLQADSRIPGPGPNRT